MAGLESQVRTLQRAPFPDVWKWLLKPTKSVTCGIFLILDGVHMMPYFCTKLQLFAISIARSVARFFLREG
jgi:multisubunit Na+/H+ antiporter MnhG subunit